jgi:cation/acetate symporter
LNATLEELGFASYTAAFVGAWDKWNVFLVAASLMVGTAGLPHVIVRFYTVRTVQAARWSGFWALLFIALLYVTAPTTAAFARYFLLTTLNERQADELPQWFRNWERTGLILWLDDGDGVVRFSNRDDNEIFRSGKLNAAELAGIRVEHQRWVDTGGTAGADGRAVLRARGLSGPDNDIIVLATPEMAELSGWIVAFVAAGGLAAALSTASGLLLVISSSVAHDLYFRVLRPQASEKQRLLVGRSAIGVAVVVAGILGIFPPAFVSEVVAFAFSLAAASFFPAIVLGIFNKRVGTVPAVAGMVVGILFSAGYIVWCSFLKMPAQTFGVFPSGVNPQGIGVLGMALNFVVTLGLTPFFPPPREGVQRMVDAVREPEDASEPVEIESALEH